MAASYCSATLAEIRPRSLTVMPWSFAHARMSALKPETLLLPSTICGHCKGSIRAWARSLRSGQHMRSHLQSQADLRQPWKRRMLHLQLPPTTG